MLIFGWPSVLKRAPFWTVFESAKNQKAFHSEIDFTGKATFKVLA